MPFVAKLSPEQWAEIRRLRTEGATYPELSERFRISISAIGRHARKEAWPGTGRTAAADRKGKAATLPSPGTAGIRGRLALRLYSVIEIKIRMMELRMHKQLLAHERDPDGTAPPAPAKEERESFAALIESINQVTEMASEPAPAADGRRKSAIAANPELTALSADIDPDGLASASEKDEFRRELAEHLGKMFPKP